MYPPSNTRMSNARKILKEFFLGLFLSGLVSVDIFNIALLKSFAGYIRWIAFFIFIINSGSLLFCIRGWIDDMFSRMPMWIARKILVYFFIRVLLYVSTIFYGGRFILFHSISFILIKITTSPYFMQLFIHYFHVL